MKNIEDPRIPGLQVALDPDAVTQLLVDNFPEFRQGFQVLEARIIDVQYKPGMQCLVLYRLKFHVPDAYRSRRQEIIIDALPEGEAPVDIPEQLLARYSTNQNRYLPTPCAYDRKAHIAIHAFPLDPVLTQLSDIMDSEIMKRKFHDLWRDRRIGDSTVVAVGGRDLVLSDEGVLHEAIVTREGLELRGRHSVLEGRGWTAPSIVGSTLVLRNETELAAYAF